MSKRYYADILLRNPERPCEVSIDWLPEEVAMHSHDFVEIIIILHGTAIQHIDAHAYPVSAGVVSVLHGETEHGFTQTTPDFTVYKIIYRVDSPWVPHERFKALLGYQALFMLEPIRRKKQNFPACLQLDGAALQEAITLVQQLQGEMEHCASGYQYMAQGYLLQLIVTLSRHYARLQDAEPTGLLRLGEAVIYLEEHFTEAVKIGELAERARISERHFVRLFRQTFHQSPSERLLELRIAHAGHLLSAGTHNVTEAAYASGFRDSNYFSRQFRRLTGVTPRAYRQCTPSA